MEVSHGTVLGTVNLLWSVHSSDSVPISYTRFQRDLAECNVTRW